MDTETSALAFRTAINEIKNTCPGISNIFILNGQKQAITRDQNTSEELVNCSTEYLTTVSSAAGIAGEIESLTCSGGTQKVNLTRYEDNYFVTLSSNETDDRALSTLARVMLPSMLKLAQEVASSRMEKVVETQKPKSIATPVTVQAPAPTLIRPKPARTVVSASEFTVENLSGISIISSDANTLYLDRALIGEWKENYGNRNIEFAIIENISTKKQLRCSFQPLKNEKLEGQNLVLVPNKVQKKLEIKKGTTVRIRPVIEDGENKE